MVRLHIMNMKCLKCRWTFDSAIHAYSAYRIAQSGVVGDTNVYLFAQWICANPLAYWFVLGADYVACGCWTTSRNIICGRMVLVRFYLS